MTLLKKLSDVIANLYSCLNYWLLSPKLAWKNVRTTLWLLRARARRWIVIQKSRFRNGAVCKPSADNRHQAIAISPRKTSRAYFLQVERGLYKVSISHSDRLIAADHKSIIAAIKGSHAKRGDLVIGSPDFQLSTKVKVPSYLGGGTEQRHGWTQEVNLDVRSSQPWITVSLRSPLHRNINIDQISLVKRPPNDAELRLMLRRWLQTINNGALIKNILYADISLSIVDGSSVWLSSMASILCRNGPTVLVAKSTPASDIVTSNIKFRHNLFILTPDDLGLVSRSFDVDTAVGVVRELDAALPNIIRVITRGIAVSECLLRSRQFKYRAAIYLTDFYQVTHEGRHIPSEKLAKTSVCVLHADTVLVQTSAIEQTLREATSVNFSTFLLPPPIPDNAIVASDRSKSKKITIGYAGKITPDWGIVELLEWAHTLKEQGADIELHIVANRITSGSVPGFRQEILGKFKAFGVVHYADLNRQAAMQIMSEMTFVWCWRPDWLENSTLELSTKLVEMAAAGARCICYPSQTNVNLLGDDYQFFIQDFADMHRLITTPLQSPTKTVVERIKKSHSIVRIADRFDQHFSEHLLSHPQRICFAGHDFKFIDPYISYLKRLGHQVVRDKWEWGRTVNTVESKRLSDWAEIVFCEWGLANAVWYSNNKPAGVKLFIRIHRQEINKRAAHFGPAINIDNVEQVIFVQEDVRQAAIKMWGWPECKTCVIPNFVMSDEYQLHDRDSTVQIKLGMVGIIPQIKRFDRAVDLLLQLRTIGHDATLSIKGPRPETVHFMQSSGRAEELASYYAVYEKIDREPRLQGKVVFDDWGNDVALWYRRIDHILSCSDLESFHYALADGVLTGCHPVVWPWAGSDVVYHPDWIVSGNDAAVQKILQWHRLSADEKDVIRHQNRHLIEHRYGYQRIFEMLSKQIGTA